MSCLVIFRDWLIRARPKEFDEFSTALAVENHRCGLLRFEPALKMLAKGRPHDLFAKKLLMQSIQDACACFNVRLSSQPCGDPKQLLLSVPES